MAERRLTTLEESGFKPDESDFEYGAAHVDDPHQVYRQFHLYWTVGGGDGKKKADWRRALQTWYRTEATKGRRFGNGRFGGNRTDENSSSKPRRPIPWERLEKDTFTGRPYCYVDNQRWEFLEAQRLAGRKNGRWPLTDAEKEVLWRFGFGEEFSSMFEPKAADPPKGDLFG